MSVRQFAAEALAAAQTAALTDETPTRALAVMAEALGAIAEKRVNRKETK